LGIGNGDEDLVQVIDRVSIGSRVDGVEGLTVIEEGLGPSVIQTVVAGDLVQVIDPVSEGTIGLGKRGGNSSEDATAV
jgi:hypothetical protein